VDMYVAFDSPGLELQRERDALLMEVFMEAEVDQETLKWLNWCRMYLQVTSVADICTADGKYIREAAWEGRRERLWQQRYQPVAPYRPPCQSPLGNMAGGLDVHPPPGDWDPKEASKLFGCLVG